MTPEEKQISADTEYWFVLINRKGKLIISDGRVQIFRRKSNAKKASKKYPLATVHPVYSLDIVEIISKNPL